jgi:hypothetical protein
MTAFGNDRRNGLPAPRDIDLFALLDEVEDRKKLGLRFSGSDRLVILPVI